MSRVTMNCGLSRVRASLVVAMTLGTRSRERKRVPTSTLHDGVPPVDLQRSTGRTRLGRRVPGRLLHQTIELPLPSRPPDTVDSVLNCFVAWRVDKRVRHRSGCAVVLEAPRFLAGRDDPQDLTDDIRIGDFGRLAPAPRVAAFSSPTSGWTPRGRCPSSRGTLCPGDRGQLHFLFAMESIAGGVRGWVPTRQSRRSSWRSARASHRRSEPAPSQRSPRDAGPSPSRSAGPGRTRPDSSRLYD